MAFYHSPETGTYHLNEVKPARVVPGNERHKWDNKPEWGQKATCIKCGCIKSRNKPEYTETYRMPNSKETTERPACNG
ncbi:hypothetical protein [Spirosoma sp.]|uniref:hypothetical protein n=1 Tax=Spirosoma sp. TaxID=1899569 RepID=UPI0026177A5B|nr:hypothetical protein [Spirosoma sp.]MCX6216580.1 hypothetical protein [Spirosoma sp.]